MLNERLRERGHQADQIVWNKHSDNPHVHQLAAHHPQRVPITVNANQLQNDYAAHAAFTPFSYEIPFHAAYQQADVVNLHLVHNFLANIFHLPIISRLRPTVWTLHDPWAMTGHCVHPFHCDRWKIGCGQCPLPEVIFAIDKDTTALNWEIKKQTYAQCRLDLVVASPWMLERVRESPLLSPFEVHVVPFGVDCDQFNPVKDTAEKRDAKKALGIDPETLVLAMRVIPGEFKGLDVLKETLARLEVNRPVTLLTFNHENLLGEYRKKFQIVELGWVHGDDNMAAAYRATDLFFMPSTAESFGMMAMESMACGIPSVVSEGTALPQTVHAPNGGIAAPHDPAALASALKDLLENDEKRAAIGRRAREIAQEKYTEERYISGMLGVYESVIDKWGRDKRAQTILDGLRPYAIPSAALQDGADSSTESETSNSDSQVSTLAGRHSAREEMPDSLTLLIKVHAKISQNKLIRRVWQVLLKPTIGRLLKRRSKK